MNLPSRGVFALVLAGGKGERLFPLTKHRSKPAVPFGGKFRLVDIPLSNCLNSDIRRVFVLTQFNSASLNQHIAQTYRFDHFSQAFVNILASEQTRENPDWSQGSADSVRQSIQHFEDIDGAHVLVLSADQLYQMDYRELVRFHEANNADITVSTIPVPGDEALDFGILRVNERNRIVHFQEKPHAHEVEHSESKSVRQSSSDRFPRGKMCLASMGIYVFRKQPLIEILTESSAHDFGQDLIPHALDRYRVMSYPFVGYWADVGTIRSFVEVNLDLTAPLPKFNFYDESRPIYTQARFLAGSKMPDCHLHESVISEGSFLNGSNIRNSVIGIRSRIGYKTSITGSYVMGADVYETVEQIEENARHGIPNIGIGDHATITNAIIDTNARIGNNVVIGNFEKRADSDGETFCIRDGIVVIPTAAIIPDGTTIG
jgi:glucose-1-phosphate adenylyltransferase